MDHFDPAWAKVLFETISIISGMLICSFWIGTRFQQVLSQIAEFKALFAIGDKTMTHHGEKIEDHEKRLTVVEVSLPAMARKRPT